MSRADLLAKLAKLEDAHHYAFENWLLSKAGANEILINKLEQARIEVSQFKECHSITREEILTYRKRHTFAAKSVGHAMSHLKTIFG